MDQKLSKLVARMVQIDPNLHLKIFSKFTQNEHFNQKEWSFNHLDITLV